MEKFTIVDKTVTVQDDVETLRENDYDEFCKAMGIENTKDEDMRFLSINNGVREIEPHAFEESQIMGDIVLPESLKTLGENAFSDNPIDKVVFKGMLKQIPSDCFSLCAYLQSVKFPVGLEVIGRDAFYSCDLREIVLPRTVTTVGSSAFNDNPYLEHVVLSNSITTMGVEDATNEVSFLALNPFTDCPYLEVVEILGEKFRYETQFLPLLRHYALQSNKVPFNEFVHRMIQKSKIITDAILAVE